MTQADEVRGHIGLTGQYAALDDYLTGRANLIMMGQLLARPAATARQRAMSCWSDSISPARRAAR